MNTIDRNEFKNISSPLPLEDTIDFHKIFGHLYQYKWIVILSSLFTFTIAYLYTFTLQPQYRTTALLQVSSQSSNHFNNVLGNIGFKNNQASPTEVELALLRTRYILEPVIKENNLHLIVRPRYFPIFGGWMARRYQGKKPANPFLGLRSYAWGGEKIEIKTFIIPPKYEGQSFRLVAGKNHSFKLFSTQNILVLNGKVGHRSTSSAYPDLSFELSTLKAHPGTEFTLSFQSPFSMVNHLSHHLKLKKIGSDSNNSSSSHQDTGIIQLELTGSDPKQIEHILNTIVAYSVEKNVQLKSREAQKTLTFLHQRLPILKKDLEQSENALNQYHAKTGTFSFLMTSQLLVRQLNTITTSLENLKAQKEELLQVYTPIYPLLIANKHQQSLLERKLQEVKKQIIHFPAARQEEINLERNTKIKNHMYETLLGNMHQLEIMKAGLVGDIIPLDNATPSIQEPINKTIISFTGFLIGMFLSVFAIALKSIFTKTIDDIDQLENEVQIPVKTVVPFSKKQKQLERTSKNRARIPGDMSRLPLILAQHDPKDISIESLQSLRISLYITNASVTKNVIAIMGSLSGVGKSFVSLNLAYVLADSGKRTLLIDADIRKGRLHRALLQPKTSGLSDYLAGEAFLEDLPRHIHGNLFFIPCGGHTRHPIELLKSPLFLELVQKTKNEYDQVIIDTPPILPVIDAVLISQHCDTKLFVVSGSSDQLDDVRHAIKKAQAHGIEIDGIVFNHRKPIARYGSKYTYYRYAYDA